MTTPKEVAQWMLKRLEEDKYLYQVSIVSEMASDFGEEFTYINENGNLAIDKKVLKEFRILAKDKVVWERGERVWRQRDQGD